MVDSKYAFLISNLVLEVRPLRQSSVMSEIGVYRAHQKTLFSGRNLFVVDFHASSFSPWMVARH